MEDRTFDLVVGYETFMLTQIIQLHKMLRPWHFGSFKLYLIHRPIPNNIFINRLIVSNFWW